MIRLIQSILVYLRSLVSVKLKFGIQAIHFEHLFIKLLDNLLRQVIQMVFVLARLGRNRARLCHTLDARSLTLRGNLGPNSNESALRWHADGTHVKLDLH